MEFKDIINISIFFLVVINIIEINRNRNLSNLDF